MRSILILTLSLLSIANAYSQGRLIPSERYREHPIILVKQSINIEIQDQVAITTVEQTFRNSNYNHAEADYTFAIPKNASISKFSMWVNDKELKGELLDAKEASRIYTEIVRKIQDPGLLESIGNSMIRMRVFPIPANSEQKVKVVYTNLLTNDTGINEYVYPIKAGLRTFSNFSTLNSPPPLGGPGVPSGPGVPATKLSDVTKSFSLTATITTQQALNTVYCPTHKISTKRLGENKVEISLDQSEIFVEQDFQLFYATNTKDISLTSLLHRPISNEDGYALLMINPNFDASKAEKIARDFVFVMDTSGSMEGEKMKQAKKALKFCLAKLDSKDRFAVVNFSTNVNQYREQLVDVSNEQIDAAQKWVDALSSTGGTAILAALEKALSYRSNEKGRPFTVVFFTDGLPTVGQTNPTKIVEEVISKNNNQTRIFTFGVGDDVNAMLLDTLSEKTKAVSTYVRPTEDLEVKVSQLQGKISFPVLTDLKMTTTNINLGEIYPPNLPDLFLGQQLTVLARYSGKGPATIKLTGKMGNVDKEYVYELNFPEKTMTDRKFVEEVWANRKVGYLLDQIRSNGESRELINEVVKLAKRYGIATPYTSYLVVPDGVMPAYRDLSARRDGYPGGMGFGGGGPGVGGPGNQPLPAISGNRSVQDFKKQEPQAQSVGQQRGQSQTDELTSKIQNENLAPNEKAKAETILKSQTQLAKAAENYRNKNSLANQQGSLGVDLAVVGNRLRDTDKVQNVASRVVNKRNCIEVGGVWVDEEFKSEMKMVMIKAQSDAYFKLLELYPEMKDVLSLGNMIIWVAPSGTAIAIDLKEGKEQMEDTEIQKLFQK